MAKLEIVENQAAYVLHSRPFRDSSLLVHLLSKDYGRVNVIAKGARKQTGNRQVRQPLQALLALQVDWQGRSDLKTLLRWDSRAQPFMLQGDRLYSALYINELLMRLLPENDSATELFRPYEACLKVLDSECDLQPMLRCFELNLLTELGYALDFEHTEGDAAIHPDGYYYWQASGLFVPASSRQNAYRGEYLMAIGQRDFSTSDVLLCAKHLIRQVFDHLLDHKPLKTREFVRQMQQQSVGVSKND